MRLYRFGYVRFLPENDTVLLEFNILTWRKQVDLLAAKQKSSPEKRPVKRKTTKKNMQPGISSKQIIAVLKSFKINRCSISIDTGNHQLNAFLYPLFYLVQVKTNKSIQINFINNNELILELENSLARMSWAYMSSKTE